MEDANFYLAIKVATTTTTATSGKSECQTERRYTTDPPSRGEVLCQRLHETAPKEKRRCPKGNIVSNPNYGDQGENIEMPPVGLVATATFP